MFASGPIVIDFIILVRCQEVAVTCVRSASRKCSPSPPSTTGTPVEEARNMFEGVVADLLNKYIGKYVSNLDSKNLNISIFKGDVELKDLQLRPEALAELNLPVEVKAGHVGQLKIDIPWTSLFSADIHVSVENVYILTGPVTDRKYDPVRERQLQAAAKRQLLESLEQSALEGVVNKASEDPTLVEKLSANLLHRIQLSVRHIHVRYEDTITNGDHAFACGLMLKQLVVCTTDAHWKPRGSAEISGSMMHKIIKMDELSLYWNPYVPEQHLLKTRLNTDGWKNILRISIDSHTIFEEELDFIMEPAAAQARLILNSDNSMTLPKLFMDFTVEEVEVLISRQQFLNLINLGESFKMMRIQQRYRKYRPDVSLKVNPNAWWHYAYTSIVEEQIRPYSWSRIKAHRAKYKQYVHVYKQYLENPDNEMAQTTLKTLEEGLDVTNILIAREQAKLQFAREAPDRARKQVKKNNGWFSWIWGEEEEEVIVEVDPKQSGAWLSTLTNEERQKLFSVIGYDENSKNQQYPRKVK
ncbi:vacuolar protein sorting-associated protein 13a-like [Plakobranchus ocellatus]|uniref:Vacuolar protein sorting-associated protein 13a-like n=1 Tax=Plakobranchus ocellatus TaxID=259542 RepID=A0AAV4DEL7_9GAST|nr:vacuolar protein sorting-associated protein 13a-like [Plakobranchus ocellatus]